MSFQEFLDFADLLPEPMLLLDRRGTLRAGNDAALAALEVSPEELTGLSLYDVVTDPRDKVTEYLRACAGSGDMLLGALEMRSTGGRIMAARVEGCLARYALHQPDTSLILLRCSDRRHGNARFLELNQPEATLHDRLAGPANSDDWSELQRLALVDALTDLPNRRALDRNLRYEWRRNMRAGDPLAAVLIDVDCFKAFNDNYGHLAGDGALQAVARCIQRVSQRPADLTARYGGEEFAVLLPDTPLEGAAHVGERIRAEVEALALTHAHSEVAGVLTVSAGAAALVPVADLEAQTLLARADEALYAAKRAGRNRVSRREAPAEHDTRARPISLNSRRLPY